MRTKRAGSGSQRAEAACQEGGQTFESSKIAVWVGGHMSAKSTLDLTVICRGLNPLRRITSLWTKYDTLTAEKLIYDELGY